MINVMKTLERISPLHARTGRIVFDRSILTAVWRRCHAEQSFFHTIGKYIAFGYLPTSDAAHEDYEIEAFGRRIKATRIDQPAYDPKRAKITP